MASDTDQIASDSDQKKRSRKSLTLDAKLEMIKLSQQGLSNARIGRILGLARQTVSSIVNKQQVILKELERATPMDSRVIRKRDGLIADMEKVLVEWIKTQRSNNVHLTQIIIQNKAKTIFESMKEEKGELAVNNKFEASRGWYSRFKRDFERSYSEWNTANCDKFYNNPDEIICFNVVEKTKELELVVEPDVAEMLSINNQKSCDEEHSEEIQEQSKGMTCLDLEEGFKFIEMAMAHFEKIDPDIERSSKVNAGILDQISCYKEIYKDKKRQVTNNLQVPPAKLRKKKS